MVLGVEPDGRPRVRLSEGAAVTATWALPYRYLPEHPALAGRDLTPIAPITELHGSPAGFYTPLQNELDKLLSQ